MSKETPVTPLCARCGSEDLCVDAYAAWDNDAQDWVLQSCYDNTVCHGACDGNETRSVDVPAELVEDLQAGFAALGIDTTDSSGYPFRDWYLSPARDAKPARDAQAAMEGG